MKLSVCCITYNQAAYISQCLDGMLMQQTNFDFEIIIGEDCSTDDTKDIILKYQQKYPGKIKLLERSHNIGVRKNFEETLLSCTGKYIALCEGDDYWTDNRKLQKQVDFLEAKEEYKICFHNTDIYHQDTGKTERSNKPEEPISTTIFDLIDHWYIMTCSMMFRNEQKTFPAWFTTTFNTDYALQLLLMGEGGKIAYLPDVMAVYRKHHEGESARIWGSDPYFWLIYLFDKINEEFRYKYNAAIKKRKKEITSILVRYYKQQLNTTNQSVTLKGKNLLRYLFMKMNTPGFYHRKFLKQKKLV